MTASTTSAPSSVRAFEPRAHFRDLLAAEWLKLWSLRSMRWAFGISALAVIVLNTNAAIADYNNWPHYDAQIRAVFVPEWAQADAFTKNAGMILMLIAGSLGAITIVSEYSSGLVRTTFAAVPARRSLLAAKIAIVTAVMFGYGAVISATSSGVTQAILSGRHIGISISYPGAMRGVIASALLAPVCALIGLGLGALIRHSATTMVTIAVLLLMLPNFFNDNHRWSADIENALPLTAWRRLLEIDSASANPNIHYAATVSGSWIVFALWPLMGVLLAAVVVDRRDL